MNILYLCAKCGTRGQGPEPCSGCGNPMEEFVAKADLQPIVENVNRLMQLQTELKATMDKYIGHVQKHCQHRWRAIASKDTGEAHSSLSCVLCGVVSTNPGAIEFYKRAEKRPSYLFPDLKKGLFIPSKYFEEKVDAT